MNPNMWTPQPKELQAALHRKWSADQHVVAFKRAVVKKAAVLKRAGVSDADAITALLAFGAEWTAANGDLPDSGILAN